VTRPSRRIPLSGRSLPRPPQALRAPGENRPPGEPADHALGRSRGGFTTKLHLVADGDGLPLAVALSAGQAHESMHATRYEKLAVHYLALVQVSMIRLLVRRLEPPLSHKP
jgi:hypothetical protein